VRDANRGTVPRQRVRSGAVLLAALALLVAPAAASTADSTAAATGAHARKARPVIPKRLLAGTGTKKGVRVPNDEVVGIVSYNVFAPGGLNNRIADIRRLTNDPRVDVLALQETRDHQGRLLMPDSIPSNWSYAQDWQQDNSAEVAVAWRSSRFELASATTLRGCRSVTEIAASRAKRGYPNADNRSAPARYTAVVVLRDLDTGRNVEIINAHANQHSEVYRGRRAGQPLTNANAQGAMAHFSQLRQLVDQSTADYTFVTGDLNIGFVGDEQVRYPRFPRMLLGPVAVSSYTSLGLRGLQPSLTTSGRFTDYVLMSRRSRAVFLSQSLPGGFHSDHRPLFVEVALR